jgi:hypothetical protein
LTIAPKVKHSAAGISRIERQLEKFAERRRVLERVRRVDVEEPAAVGAELLDRDLRGRRPEREDLL